MDDKHPSHLHTSLPIAVRPPHASVSKPLLLPNLDPLLDLFQALLTSLPSSLSMSRGHSNENALLSNIDLAQSMRHSNCHKLVLFTNRASNGLQCPESQWRV